MTFQEIKNAVNAGCTVKWKDDSYEVVKDARIGYIVMNTDRGYIGKVDALYLPDFYLSPEFIIGGLYLIVDEDRPFFKGFKGRAVVITKLVYEDGNIHIHAKDLLDNDYDCYPFRLKALYTL